MPANDTPALDHDAALAACARGDRGALRRLYDAEARYLLGVALRIVRDRQRAEDVLQDAFVSIWEKAATFDAARGAGRGWIYSIVRHRALNAVRDDAREVAVDEATLEALDEQQSAAAHDCRHEAALDRGPLHDCLGRLDGPKRSSIVLAYVDGCSHAEIAERLAAPLGTVKAWIRRGLLSLRECLG